VKWYKLPMISRWLLVCLSLCTLSAFGQSTTVSATITDSDGTVWANGTYTIIFTPNPAYPGTSRYIWSGGNLNTNPIVGTINGSGTFSLSLPSNTEITPAGSTWNFTICPNAIQKCQSINVSITGATQDLTAVLSAIALAPRFAATPGAYGYTDNEVSPVPVPGGTYYNVTLNSWRQWNGTTWQTISTGGAPPQGPHTIQGADPSGTNFVSTNELIGNTFATPTDAISLACQSPSIYKAVFFPVGTYSAIPAGKNIVVPLMCSGLHIRCASPTGTVFSTTGANYLMKNPNSEAVSPGGGVDNITVENCGFDMTADPTNILGGIDIKGVQWSYFAGNHINANNNTAAAILEDGANFTNNNGDYNNTFIGNTIYDNSVDANGIPNSSGICYSVVNSSNDNHHFGGSCDRFGNALNIQSGNNNTFELDGEGYTASGATAAGIVLGNGALGNAIRRFRLENNYGIWVANGATTVKSKIADTNGNLEVVTSCAGSCVFGSTTPTWPTSPIGATTVSGTVTLTLYTTTPTYDVIATSGSKLNSIDVYQSGFGCGVQDSSGQNSYPNATTFGCPSIPSNTNIATTHSGNGWVSNGYWNTSPGDAHSIFSGGCADGYQFGCFAFTGGPSGGEVQASRAFILGNQTLGLSGYHKITSLATTQRLLTIPDAGGQFQITGNNVLATALNQATIPSTNYNSNQVIYQGSWYTGQLQSGLYVAGITATGSTGQTCTLTGFNNGLTGATATVALTGTNTIASSTPLVVTIAGSGGSSATPPTTATASNGTATCSGTATLSSVSIGAATNSFFTFDQTGTGSNPSQNLITNCNGSTGVCSYFFETGATAASPGSFNIFNPIAATPPSTNTQAPQLNLIGNVTDGTSSFTSNFRFTPSTATGANPLNTLTLSYQGKGTSELDLNYGTVKVNGTVIGTQVRGVATLASGTATVSNSAACSVGSSCVYKLSNCGPNSSTAIGLPSVGVVTAGTSFVINSLSSTNTVVTGDASTICWQIN
jgi:hypothetical protein